MEPSTPLILRPGAGAIVLRGDSLLMVRLGPVGRPQWWMPPGGGMEPGESLLECAEREAHEETGLRVHAERILYIQEYIDSKHHHLKFWVLCHAEQGDPHLDNRVPEEVAELHEVRFIRREELSGMAVSPKILRDRFWEDCKAGFPEVRYLGLGPL